MKRTVLFGVFSIFLVWGCGESEQSQPPVIETEDLTPSALEKSFVSDEMSFRARGMNVLEKLYDEALDNDKVLQDLVDQTEFLVEMAEDSLQEFQDYRRVCENYYTSAEGLLGRVADSAMSEQIVDLIQQSKKKFESNCETLDALHFNTIENGAQIAELNTVLKIVVTSKMIETYQKNEMPSTQPIKSLVSDQKGLMENLAKEIENRE